MRLQTLLLGLVFGLFLLGTNVGATDFVDWVVIDTNNDIAQGKLSTIDVTMSGQDITYGVTDGSFTILNNASFCPPLISSDVVEFIGTSPAFSYTVTFSAPVTDPILHISSLASTLVFSGVTLTKLCGQAAFVVSGSQVSGACLDGVTPNDANGTVKVNGVVSGLSFTAYWAGCLGFTRDGTDIQIGVDMVTGTKSVASNSLSQNYPNPFNPQTTIAFSVKERGVVKLRVYNVAGQLVRTLASEELAAGAHTKVWDGRDDAGQPVSSGVYFYKLVANNFSQTKKMVILK